MSWVIEGERPARQFLCRSNRLSLLRRNDGTHKAWMVYGIGGQSSESCTSLLATGPSLSARQA